MGRIRVELGLKSVDPNPNSNPNVMDPDSTQIQRIQK